MNDSTQENVRCPFCGSSRFDSLRRDPQSKISTCACVSCGIHRITPFPVKQELSEFYRTTYHSKCYTHSFAQDLKAAKKRLSVYRIKKGSSLLDVGSGNGAFVEVCVKKGIEAEGCDLSPDARHPDRVYQKDLLDIRFPTDHFDVITCHDMIEHLVSPRQTLEEIFRILKQEGVFFLELPNFWSPEGKHHWKKEHLWYFNPDQIQKVLQVVGFSTGTITQPIPGKILLIVKKPKESRVKILVPPGVGDIYWPMVKMRSFLKKEGIGMPDILISSPKPELDRSIDFVRRVPFVHAAGYLKHDERDPMLRKAYHDDSETIYENVLGCDYFISYNGTTRWGKALEEVDHDLSCEWDFPMWMSLKEQQFGQDLVRKHGRFLVLYLVGYGTYQKWVQEFPLVRIYHSLREIRRFLHVPVIMVGASWDKNMLNSKMKVLDEEGFLIDMVGHTSLEQLFGLLRASEGVIGYPSGLTMMSVVFKRPTLMLWNQYYHPRFWWNACPPGSRENWYQVIGTDHASEEAIRDLFLDIAIERAKGLPRSFPVKGMVTFHPIVEKPAEDWKPSTPLTGVGSMNDERAKKGSEFVQVKSSIEGKDSQRVVGKPEKILPSVVCVLKTGGDYTAEYVERLSRSVKRNLKLKHDFVCLTNHPTPIPGVDVQYPLQKNWPGMWSKVEIFRQGLFKGPVLYLDLDMVVVGSLDELIRDYDGKFSSLHGWHKDRKDRISSAMMMFQGDYSRIYDLLCEREGQILNRDYAWWEEQEFIAATLKEVYHENPRFLQDHFPVVSFKWHCMKGAGILLPKEAKVICFHGHPRPHEVVSEVPWLQEAWR